MFCSVEAGCATYRALPAGELAVIPNTGHEITHAVVVTMTEFQGRHADG